MDTLVDKPPTSQRYAAGPLHTIFLLLFLGAIAFMGWSMAGRARETPNPHRVRMYLLTLAFDWILLGYVIGGMRRHGSSISLVLGNRWQSARHLLRDIGIAAGFWLISAGILLLVALLLHIESNAANVQFILPRNAIEFVLWVALAVTAGICEEAIFRGYLQYQFTAVTRNSAAGIVLSSAAFGFAHAYQGSQMIILIGVYGLMFGILAHWRGSVRPGMIAHAWQDSFSGIVGALMRH
jgi:membrane protease YdiL (CAAX protease family)